MALREPLDAIESRIFGTLVEKSLTTPESYPLSMNALVNGCNQKSNRDPVSDYDARSIGEAMLRLRLHHLVRERHSSGARVVKYEHDGGTVLEVDTPALAVLAELLLRGPQQPGELRGRASRMAPIHTLDALETILADLAARRMVERLPPSPGSRAPRWRQLLAPSLHGGGPAGTHSAPAASPAHAAPPHAAPGAPHGDAAHATPAHSGAPGVTAPAGAASTGSIDAPVGSPGVAQASASADLAARLAALERRVAQLERRLAEHPDPTG